MNNSFFVIRVGNDCVVIDYMPDKRARIEGQFVSREGAEKFARTMNEARARDIATAKWMTLILVLITGIAWGLASLPVAAEQAPMKEADYVREFCRGEIEHVLSDKTRVDCLLENEAQEYDYGKKWAEGIGQALWYAMNTGRRASVVYIIRDDSDRRGLARAEAIVEHYGLPVTIHRVGN